MTNLPSGPDDRRYSDHEMKLIFERAGEADVAAHSEQGHSLAEMQEIARQVGLDPNAVAIAASSLRAPETRTPIIGAPVRFHQTRTLPRTLTKDEIIGIALRIRETTGLRGELRNVPGGVEWRERTATGLFAVDFTPRGDTTRIDLTVGREDEALLTSIGAGIAGAIVGVAASFFVAEAVNAVGFGEVAISAVSAIGGAIAGVRSWWPRVSRRWAKRTDALMRSIGEAAEQSAAPPKSVGDGN